MSWKVVVEPHGDNPGTAAATDDPENMSGMIISVENKHGDREEVSRVGYIRRATKHPERSFKDQLDEEISRAHQVVEALNAHDEGELE